MGKGSNAVRLCWCLFFFAAVAVVFSAGNPVTVSGVEVVGTRGRSLLARLDDYGDPTANRGHDPRTKPGSNGGSGGSGGRRVP